MYKRKKHNIKWCLLVTRGILYTTLLCAILFTIVMVAKAKILQQHWWESPSLVYEKIEFSRALGC